MEKNRILTPQQPRTTPNWREVVKYDSQLMTAIRAQQNSMRVVGIIPEWYNFTHTELWRDIRPALTRRERAKYQAWWTLMYSLKRDTKDKETMLLAVAYLVREKAKRAYAKTLPVNPAAFHIPPAHAKRIEEYCRTHFEALVPG